MGVQRGVCTCLDKARRVQEAGGVGVLFVNSAETLFVPHGTDDDPGGDVWIPAVCMRKGAGEALLAFCDPCPLAAHPDWPLRNLLALVSAQALVPSVCIGVHARVTSTQVSFKPKSLEQKWLRRLRKIY